MAVGNQVNDTKDCNLVGSWGRFARRMNFERRNRDDQEEYHATDTIWLYVAISALYFFMIGMVVFILLLAPKFKTSVPTPDTSIGIVARETLPPPELTLAAETEEFSETESKDSFHAAPKDPLYEIDPLSPIFRGDVHKRKMKDVNDDDGRLRVNSKFLQD